MTALSWLITAQLALFAVATAAMWRLLTRHWWVAWILFWAALIAFTAIVGEPTRDVPAAEQPTGYGS